MKSFCAACILVIACAGSAGANGFDDFNRGVAAKNHRDFAAAVSFLTAALSAGDLAPDLRPVALVDRGAAYFEEDKYTEAIADFDAALKLNPQPFEALSGRARALAASGNMTAALTDCQNMINSWPYSTNVYELCGRLDWEMGNYPNAASKFETALQLNPRNPYSLLWYRLALLNSHSESKSRMHEFARFRDIDGWPSPILDLYLSNGSLEGAERAANDADDETRRNRTCEVGFYGGEWQLLQGDVAGARVLLKEAVDLCREDYIESEPAKSELKRLNNGATQ